MYLCVCLCVAVKVCGFFLPLGEGELIDKLFNTHEGKKMFLSLLAIVFCFVLFFFFLGSNPLFGFGVLCLG